MEKKLILYFLKVFHIILYRLIFPTFLEDLQYIDFRFQTLKNRFIMMVK